MKDYEISHFERENYRIFHLTKEEKRNEIYQSQWKNIIGSHLEKEIYDTKKFEEVKDSINYLISKNSPENIHDKLILIDEIAKVLNLNKKNASHFLYHKGKNAYKFPYDEKKQNIKLLYVSPSGFERLNPEDENTILINYKLPESEIKKEILYNSFMIDFWNSNKVDGHQLFHVHFYNLWKRNYNHVCREENFDRNILNLYKECESKAREVIDEYDNKNSCMPGKKAL